MTEVPLIKIWENIIKDYPEDSIFSKGELLKLLIEKVKQDLKKLFEPKELEMPYTGEYAMGWNDCLRKIIGDEK